MSERLAQLHIIFFYVECTCDAKTLTRNSLRTCDMVNMNPTTFIGLTGSAITEKS